MDRIDIHGRKRRLKLALSSIRGSEEISDRNKEDILTFCEYCSAVGLSIERVDHYAWILKKIGELFNKDFRKAAKQDIIELLRKIELREISAWTKHDYRVTLRKFYKWLRNSEEYPEEVNWIKVNVGLRNTKLPEQLLNEKDVEKLIKACPDPQMKALVAVLWETGFRVGELLNLNIKHVEFDERFARLVVDGKTGMRRVIVLLAWPYLNSWLNLHPLKDDRTAPLWITRAGTPMNYVNLRKRLQILAKKTKIKKPVNPHTFRHSRATFLAQHLTEAQMSQYLGWIPGTKMAAVYVHLSGRDLEQPMLKLYGLENEDKPKEALLKPSKCWKCGAMNPTDASVCTQCGVFLKVEAAVQAEQDREKELDEFKNRLTEMEREMERLRLHSAPVTNAPKLTDKEIDRIIENRKELLRKLEEQGLVTHVTTDSEGNLRILNHVDMGLDEKEHLKMRGKRKAAS